MLRVACRMSRVVGKLTRGAHKLSQAQEIEKKGEILQLFLQKSTQFKCFTITIATTVTLTGDFSLEFSFW